MKRFNIVLPKDDGGVEVHPMKEWLRQHPGHLLPGLDATASTSHQLRNGLKKLGWSVQELPDQVQLTMPGAASIGTATEIAAGTCEPRMELSQAAAALQYFCGADLAGTLARIESSLQGTTTETCPNALANFQVKNEVLTAAAAMKRIAGQINVVIHALGILLCLPRLMEPGEAIEYVSLGAGNTGKAFDLETTHRIAEFKFIHWKGGPEVIRQNALFKDFYLLAEHQTHKQKYLYVLGTAHPLKFLKSGRSLSSVLSRHVGLQNQFRVKFGDRFQKVREYYALREQAVIIEDVSRWLPVLVAVGIDGDEAAG